MKNSALQDEMENYCKNIYHDERKAKKNGEI